MNFEDQIIVRKDGITIHKGLMKTMLTLKVRDRRTANLRFIQCFLLVCTKQIEINYYIIYKINAPYKIYINLRHNIDN